MLASGRSLAYPSFVSRLAGGGSLNLRAGACCLGPQARLQTPSKVGEFPGLSPSEFRALEAVLAVLPWLPWLSDDWLTSPTRLAMGTSERSIYRDLLDYQWKDGFIPDDPEKLSLMVAVPREEFDRAWPVVRRRFTKDRYGRLRNRKLAVLRTSAILKHDAFVLRSKKAAHVKWSKVRDLHATGIPQALPASNLMCVSVSSLEVKKERKSETIGRNPPEFYDRIKAEIWDRYPGLKCENDLRLAMSVIETEAKLAEVRAGLDRLIASGNNNGKPWSMTRWINEERWTAVFPKYEADSEREQRLELEAMRRGRRKA